MCLKTLLTGGADFTGGLGGCMNSSRRLFTFALLWLNTASLTNTGVGIGLFKLALISSVILAQQTSNIFGLSKEEYKVFYTMTLLSSSHLLKIWRQTSFPRPTHFRLVIFSRQYVRSYYRIKSPSVPEPTVFSFSFHIPSIILSEREWNQV